jgi:hypothetical protein
VRKARRKEVTRKTMRRWEDNNQMDIREISWDVMNRIDLAEDREVEGSSVSIKCWKILE